MALLTILRIIYCIDFIFTVRYIIVIIQVDHDHKSPTGIEP